MSSTKSPQIAIVMGSKSDWQTMKFAVDELKKFSVSYETQIVSAHRTPDLLFEFANEAQKRGIKVIIAAAGGAAHLPGMLAAKTTLPVIGVPIQSKALSGLDSLLSIVQMPAGIPVATVAIGEAGAKNSAYLAVAMLANFDEKLASELAQFRNHQTSSVLANLDPSV